MTKRVMVIGGSGFIATYVIRSLVEAGDFVLSLDLQEPNEKLRFVLGPASRQVIFEKASCLHLADLLRAAQAHTIDSVIFMAAIQDLDYANRHPLPVYELHLKGLLNVLETARLQGLQRVVVGSTTGVFTPRQYEPMDEAHPIHSPVTGHLTGHYGASKAAAEVAAMAYHTTNGVDLVVARLSHVYGFGMWGTAYIRPGIENIALGLPTHFETGSEALFDYTYVRDAARGVLCCLHAEADKLKQRVFLIGYGQLHSGADAVATLRQLAPDLEVTIGPGMNERQRVSFRTRLDLTAAREQLGYQPEYDLLRGLSEFLELQRRYLASGAS